MVRNVSVFTIPVISSICAWRGPGHVLAVDDQPVAVDVEDPEAVSLPGSLLEAPVIAGADPAVEVAVLACAEVDVGRHRGLDVEPVVAGDRDRDRVTSGPQGLGGQRPGEVGDGRPRVYAVLAGRAGIVEDTLDLPEGEGAGSGATAVSSVSPVPAVTAKPRPV